MSRPELRKPHAEGFLVVLIVGVLLILPQFGATTMMAGSALGLIAWVFMFGKRLKGHYGLLTLAICLAVLAAFGIAYLLVAGIGNEVRACPTRAEPAISRNL